MKGNRFLLARFKVEFIGEKRGPITLLSIGQSTVTTCIHNSRLKKFREEIDKVCGFGDSNGVLDVECFVVQVAT